ncbi:MAG: SRPBCC family protein [Nitrospirae bacterium]|nr:SRPBCC family protein [Nitrospirota bacterium]
MGDALQGLSEIVIQAGPERVYAILEDSTLLPRWAPMVKHTTGRTEKVGSVRTYQVEWEGRKDEVAERCVEAIPNKKIAWIMEKGMMTRMFSRISFWYVLEPQGRSTTVLQMGFLYEPRHILARLMYALIMKRKLKQLRRSLLENLKNLAEAQAA